jgi:nicotinamidase-related amidase
MRYTEELIIKTALDAYKNGVAKIKLEKERCVLLVIDMQDEFVKPGWASTWIPEATRQVPKIKKMITTCREKSIPVIFTVFSDTHNYFDRPKTGKAMPIQYPNLGSNPEWFKYGNIWEELKPQKDEIVIHKPSYGAFYDTPLETILKSMDKDTIIISGTLTNCCCGTTARQGYERGFKVIFGSDITSTYTKEMQEAELGILRLAFAKVQSSEEIIKELESP